MQKLYNELENACPIKRSSRYREKVWGERVADFRTFLMDSPDLASLKLMDS